MSPHIPDRRALPLLSLVAVIAAYASSFAGGFQFDDFNVIVREAGAQSPAAWWASQPGIRPLLKLSYALNRASPFGLAGFHAVNLLIHLGNTWLVAALLQRLVPAARDHAGDAAAPALLGALVFALHPVQTEAVTYLSGRSTSLAAFFALASIVLWLQGQDEPERRWLRLASLLSFVAALACKEYVAVVPLALLLCAATRAPAGAAWLGAALRGSASHWAVVLAGLFGAAMLPRYRMLLETSLATRDLVANLATQAQGVTYLAGQLVRPDRLNADPALPAAAGIDAAVLVHGLALVALIVTGVWAMRRQRTLGFALLWFFLWLAPTNSLLPRLDVVNDRQLYVALVGPAFGFARLVAQCRPPAWRAALVAALALGLGAATFARNRVYADELVFWADVARKSPHNARAFANLGHALALVCRTADARQALTVALQLDPGADRAAVNLQLLAGEDDSMPDPGGACAPPQAAISIRPEAVLEMGMW